MRKIDKDYNSILSTKYRAWVDNLIANNTIHPKSNSYYDDVVMDLYRVQKGICAYTEMYICVPELCLTENWIDGKYKIADDLVKRTDHFGELEHFDPSLKKEQYWSWDNLFMIHSTINSRKSDRAIVPYLKPDLADYTPEKYFDYDDVTHRFIPNTDLDSIVVKEIQHMIDNVLFLNHGVVINERKSYINNIKFRIDNNLPYSIDRFFTSVNWSI